MASQSLSTNGSHTKGKGLEQTSANVEELSVQIEKLRTDLSELTRTVGTIATTGAREARTAVRDRVAHAGAEGREALHRAEDRIRAYGDEAGDYVRRNPVQSLAIAAGLGLVIGFLTRR